MPAKVTEHAARPPTHLLHLGAPRPEVGDHALVCVLACRPNDDLVDQSNDGVDPANMIKVIVREHEQIDAINAQLIKAGSEKRGIRSRVDEGNRTGAAHDEGIALPHVATGDLPVAWPPKLLSNSPTGERSRIAHEREHQSYRRPASPATPPQDRDDSNRARCRQQDHPSEALGPGKLRPRGSSEECRNRRDPCGGKPGELAQEHPHRRKDPQRHTGGKPYDGGDGRGRRGQHVSHHPVHRQRGVQQHDHGLARQLGGNRDRDDQRQPAWEPLLQHSRQRAREQ